MELRIERGGDWVRWLQQSWREIVGGRILHNEMWVTMLISFFAEMTMLWGYFFILTNIDLIDYLSLALVKYGIHEKAVMNFLSGKPALIEKLLFLRRSLAPQQRIAMREAPESGDDVAMDVRVTGCVSAKLSVKF